MATEVTKLITVSLGKIQQSRQQKCGLNLRKSLLVASVLHKARDIYVAEIKHRRTDTTDELPSKRIRLVTQKSVVETEQNNDTHSESEPSESTDNGSTPAPTLPTPSKEDVAVQRDSVIEVNKENSPPHTEQTTEDKNTSSCNRCLKRRHEPASTNNVTSFTQSQENREKIVPKKRLRAESVITTDSSDTNNNTPTDSAPNTAINSLVTIFSSAFAGLSSEKKDSTNCTSSTTTELNTFSICREPIALRA